MKFRNIIFELDDYFQFNKYNQEDPWIKLKKFLSNRN